MGSTPLRREAEDLPFASASAEQMHSAVIPDAMAVTLGLQLDIAADMAAYQILKPLFFSALPLPWEVHKKEHGRWDFFHAGVKEYRQLHPMHGFFAELLDFLRTHANTSTPLTELLEAQVFRTASPEIVRYRLGIWEGPIQDAETGGITFLRQWPGRDEVCVAAMERGDDPRLEAAANLSFRLGAWLHLWKGFAKEEPFPLLEGRLAALCQQLGESVVTAPGLATSQMIAHMEEILPRLEPQPVPEVIPLTEEEEAYQPLVTSILAKAYSVAIAEAARRETEEMMEAGRLPGDSDGFAARIACNLAYHAAQIRVADLEHEEWVAQQFPPEVAEEEDYEREFEDDFFCEDEEEEEENTSEEDVEAQGEREVEAETETPAEDEETEEDSAALVEDPEPQVEETDDVQRVIQTCKGFIARLEEDHGAWAKEQLRPWTPITGRQDPEPVSPKPQWPESPKVALHRKRLGWDAEIWSPTREAAEGEAVPDPPAEGDEEPTAPPGEEEEQELLAFVQQLGEEAEGLAAQEGSSSTPPVLEEAEAAVAQEAPLPAEAAPEVWNLEGLGAEEQPPGEEAVSVEEEADVPQVYKEMREPATDLTMAEEDWPMLKRWLPEPLEEQVDAFRRRLQDATKTFNECTGMPPETDEQSTFQRSYGWNWMEQEPQDEECYRTGREFLDRPVIKDPLCRDRDGGEEEEHDMVVPGAAARPPSPNRGPMRVPPYLVGTQPPPAGSASGRPAFPLSRARSSSPRLVRRMPKTAKQQAASARITRQAVKKPPAKAKLEPRPGSADCYTRPRRDSLMPFKPSPAALEAAKSTKRFLSRTCGTMQAALATFDPSGDGRFSREEWEQGLEKLDFTVGHDCQEIFTVLDKRQHHMLTLSDLLDYCKGIPIDTGMPSPGIRGAMSKLFQEILDEQLGLVVQEALIDVATEGLLHPSGAPGELPDVFAYCKHLQQVKKQRELESPKNSEARQPSPSHGLASAYSQEGFESDLSEESEQEEETESEVSSSDSESESDSDSEEEDVVDQAVDAPPPTAKVKKARDKDRATCLSIAQVTNALRLALDRDPSPEEVTEQRLKEASGGQPTEKEIKKEAKKAAKSEAKVAGIAPPPSKVTKKEKQEATTTKVVTEELRVDLGRAPTRGEVAKKKLEEAVGRPPTQQEIRKEVKRAVKIEVKKEAARQERQKRKEQEREREEVATPVSLQEKVKRDKKGDKKPSSSSSSRRGARSAAADSKPSSESGSRLDSRGKQGSGLGSRGGSRQGKRGHKRGSMLEMVLNMSGSMSGDEQGISEGDLEWMESALSPSTAGRDKEVNPIDEITKAKEKVKKKGSHKKSLQESSTQSQSRHRASSSDLPMARFSGFSFVEREDYGQDLPESKLLPFVPRPASEICKTYGHIFRILADPRVRRLKVDPKQKRSVNVSVPRQPGASFGSSGAKDDSQAPPGRGLKSEVAQSGSKSSPSLHTTQASTTTTWRPGSSQSDRPGQAVVLPPLAEGEKQRPRLPDLGNPDSAIDRAQTDFREVRLSR